MHILEHKTNCPKGGPRKTTITSSGVVKGYILIRNVLSLGKTRSNGQKETQGVANVSFKAV